MWFYAIWHFRIWDTDIIFDAMDTFQQINVEFVVHVINYIHVNQVGI